MLSRGRWNSGLAAYLFEHLEQLLQGSSASDTASTWAQTKLLRPAHVDRSLPHVHLRNVDTERDARCREVPHIA